MTWSSTAAPTSSTFCWSTTSSTNTGLLIYPTILGSGKHMFRDGIDTHYLQLVGTRPSALESFS